MCKEETQVMLNWGLEGEHWEIKDGERVFNEAELALQHSDQADAHAIE